MILDLNHSKFIFPKILKTPRTDNTSSTTSKSAPQSARGPISQIFIICQNNMPKWWLIAVFTNARELLRGLVSLTYDALWGRNVQCRAGRPEAPAHPERSIFKSMTVLTRSRNKHVSVVLCYQLWR